MKFIRGKQGLIGFGGLGALSVIALSVLVFQLNASLLGPEGQYFDSAGVQIHYTDEGQGTPVLLVHGLSLSGNLQWRKHGTIDALKQNYRVITLDNRGHGRSGKPHDPAQYGPEMAEDLVRLLDHLGIQKAHVIGYSMGGFITLKFVAAHPDRLLSAAVCAAGWEQPTPENLAFAENVAVAFEHGEFGPLRKRLGGDTTPPTFTKRFGTRAFLTWFNDPLALAALSRASNGLNVSENQLRANKVPVITIIGDKDGLLPDAQALHEHMANHQLILLPGKTHMNADVSPDFLKDILAFLETNTPKTQS